MCVCVCVCMCVCLCVCVCVCVCGERERERVRDRETVTAIGAMMISPCEEVIDGLGFMGTITISEPVMSHQRPWYHHRVVALEPLHRK